MVRDVSKMCSNDHENHIPLIRMCDEFPDERAITIPLTELKSEPGLKAQVKTTSRHLLHVCTDICLLFCLKLTFLHPKRPVYNNITACFLLRFC